MRESVRKQQEAQRRGEVTERLLGAARMAAAEAQERYSLAGGLTAEAVERSVEQYGTNHVDKHRKASVARRLFDAFFNPFTCILLVLAIVQFVTAEGTAEVVTGFIIVFMVCLSGFLKFIQEARSGSAAARLSEMVKTTAMVERQWEEETEAGERVVRQGRKEIPLAEIVTGDIVHLSAGDMVPADVRIVRSKDLFVSQAALTGESEPLEKTPGSSTAAALQECQNMAFMGSNVVSGSAVAIVVAVGNDTLFGGMARSLNRPATTTSFEKGVNSVSWVLIRFMLVMVPVVLVLNGFTKGDWVSAFMFAITVAVGLTPEMLPMIVTTCLAKGAVTMSEKKTIIKNINSIQNFGAMDILCTDKTGTLTQDKVVLQIHIDVHGNPDPRVLYHGFLNSYYQTGLKNLMDIAIVNKAQEEIGGEGQLKFFTDMYEKVDEIPFDFQRRRMSVVVLDKKKKRTQMITKGAVEEMLAVCNWVEDGAEDGGRVIPMTDDLRDEVRQRVHGYNRNGMRVLALAQKSNPSPVGAFSVQDESDMVLVGYLAFLDPPKLSTEGAIRTLHEYGVETKVLTGDNDIVTRCVCDQVGLKSERILLGSDIETMSDADLAAVVEDINVFAKLSPQQKVRIVAALRSKGHTVGFMGDGINDAAAMKEADVGISVDTAVDVAKESADIILLEKDLMVLENGIVEGRKTYANMIKYIKITASSNFGNVFSILAASAILPFLPMRPVQFLLLNLIYDVSCTALPWDNVDTEYLKKPRQWNADSVGRFMLWIGPTSSVFDITTYLLMYFVICPAVVSGGVLFHDIPAGETALRLAYIAVFQAGWFVESMWSQTLIIHFLRTPKIPFIQSRASFHVIAVTLAGIIALTAIPFTPIARFLGLAPLPWHYFGWLLLTVVLYTCLAQWVKHRYTHRFGELH